MATTTEAGVTRDIDKGASWSEVQITNIEVQTRRQAENTEWSNFRSVFLLWGGRHANKRQWHTQDNSYNVRNFTHPLRTVMADHLGRIGGTRGRDRRGSIEKAIMTYESVGVNHLLCDVLGRIACLSKAFQQKSLSFATIQVSILSQAHSTNPNGRRWVKADACDVKTGLRLREMDILDSPRQRQVFTAERVVTGGQIKTAAVKLQADVSKRDASSPLLLAETALPVVIPAHTAFSCLKRVKTTLRSTLTASNLDHLLTVRIEGPEVQDVNFDQAVVRWLQKLQACGCDAVATVYNHNTKDVYVDGTPEGSRMMPNLAWDFGVCFGGPGSAGHWALLGMDLIGPLPTTGGGNRYIFSATDYFTKWVEAFPMKTKSAEEVAACIATVFVSIAPTANASKLPVTTDISATRRGNRYIFSATDYFTKWVEAFPMKTKSAEEVAACIMNMYARHGASKAIITDQGGEFNNKKYFVFRIPVNTIIPLKEQLCVVDRVCRTRRLYYGTTKVKSHFDGRRFTLTVNCHMYLLYSKHAMASGMHVSHICHQKLCINISHLSYKPPVVYLQQTCVSEGRCTGQGVVQ
ncbi:Gypsy retrotransposon integrase-like protein 1 [Branchiostoma belcheri]|nr:Gypsy retrotransposon integrase-like protein 1 [Branchiostoma belcheri]